MMYGNYNVGARIQPIGAMPRIPAPPAMPRMPMPPAMPRIPAPPMAPMPPVQLAPRPMMPVQQPVYYPQMPVQQPGVYSPYQPQGNFLTDMFHGIGEQLQTVGQYVLHPFDASKRVMPYRNPYQPVSTGENVGKLLVDGALVAGAFVLGKGLLGGGLGNIVGGGARVGFSNGIMYGLGSAINGVFSFAGKVVMAPFRLVGMLFSGIGAGVGIG